MDVSDPANPREVGDYQDYVCCVSGVTVVERAYAYVASGVNLGLRDMWVMDVSEAAQSFQVGVYGAPGSI